MTNSVLKENNQTTRQNGRQSGSSACGKDYHNSNLMSFDMNNSDGKASLEQQKSPETTTVTQDLSKFYWFYA